MATGFEGSGQTGGQTGGASWLDPRLVRALAPAVPRIVTLPAAVTTILLRSDPLRVAFSIIKSINLNSFPRIGPGGAANLFALREDVNVDVRTFVLTDWLSLVMGEWYATSTAGGDVEVWEFQQRF